MLRTELLTPAGAAVELPLPPGAAVEGAGRPVSFRAFLRLGVEHILTGYDHLLFLLGLLLACRRFKTMALVVTCFTLAHSVTLALAALDVVSRPPRVVEPLIAASIVFVGIENLLRREEPRWRWALTFGFGLIHGFGFAGVLREIGRGSSASSLLVSLFSFNLGVELGQLAVTALLLPLLWKLRGSNNLGTTPDLVVGNVPVSADGDAQAFINSLPAELYSINVRVDAANQYWAANPFGVGVLNVVVPSDEQQSSGGGWVEDAASRGGKSSFGFNVRAANKAGQARGNLTFTLRGADGFNYVLKSNTWSDGYLQFAAEPGVTPDTYTRSNFKGRASLQKVDPVTGAVVSSVGNYSFEVFTADGDQLAPRRADALSITIRDGNGQLWHQVGAGQTLVTLGGGNVTNKAR